MVLAVINLPFFLGKLRVTSLNYDLKSCVFFSWGIEPRFFKPENEL
jgi:hypothetical protein